MKTTSTTAMLAGRIAAVGLGLVVMVALLVLLPPRAAHAATFTVNRTGDAQDANLANAACDVNASQSGNQCTLRAAIQEANDTAGADTINFNIVSDADVKTISPASQLPIITDPVTIDGYTQPGASANTLAEGNDAVLKIQLNGANAVQPGGASGLEIRASNSTIKGLVINRFNAHGVIIRGSGATGNKVEGNFIGTNANGTTDRGNTGAGVVIGFARNNTIGGTASGARNVISGNGNDFGGVHITGAGATENKVEGNFIGTTANGTGDLGNGGVNGGNGVVINTPNNTIGGTASGARNTISGNSANGVLISGSEATGNQVMGNRIGTKADGTGDLGNDVDGVSIASAPNNTIGGTASGAGNTISGNGDDGVTIFNSGATGNKVERNGISGNDNDGVVIAAPNNTVGGTTSGAGNGITANGDDGVEISGSGATGNRVLFNSIFSNTGLGIDLGTSGVTANDNKDLDAGANNLQNFPVITSARKSSTSPFLTTITGTINSNPFRSFTIQCFVAAPDPSNHGEGQIPVAQTTVTTNANGAASFACPASPIPQVKQMVTATATNTASGDTSEFSRNVGVVVGP